jgi:ribonuclease T1
MKSRAVNPVLLFLLTAVIWNTGPGRAIAAPAGPVSIQALEAGPAIAQEASSASSCDGLNDRPELPPSSRLPQIPAKAHAVLQVIQDRDGDPLPGYVGGRNFQNRERKLPRGNYREYDVEPRRPGKNRGAERIVIERQTGKAYYTGDHYRTFIPMN